MTYSELQEWQEYTQHNPFPSETQELQMAVLSFLISTANGGKSKVEDFVISNKQKQKKQSNNAQLENQIKSLFGSMSNG